MRAVPEAFKDFELKNGYRIVSVRWGGTLAGGTADDRVEVAPQVGSTNPYAKIRVDGVNRANFEVTLYIEIEGPAASDPYR